MSKIIAMMTSEKEIVTVAKNGSLEMLSIIQNYCNDDIKKEIVTVAKHGSLEMLSIVKIFFVE